jgi:AbrB family looped-hinge helix DNA binding protein
MLKYRSTVARKGQVTIPKEFRDEFDLSEGDKVEWSREGNKIVLKRYESVVDSLYGSLREFIPGEPLSIEEENAAYEKALTEELRKKYEQL